MEKLDVFEDEDPHHKEIQKYEETFKTTMKGT
jgi:hypothetical protein